VAFSADGQRLASVGTDNTVRVWDVSQGGGEVTTPLLTIKAAYVLMAVAFSPDGRRLASAGSGLTVDVWDVATAWGELATPAMSLKGHTGFVPSVCWSPDGRRLFSGGQDKLVKVWETATGQELLSLQGHAGIVWRVALSKDGRRLASASQDGTVNVWEADLPTPEVLLQRKALGLVESLFTELVRKGDVLDRLRGDATLDEALRQEALARAERYVQDPLVLARACWAVVGAPGAAPAAYRRALLQAEEACRLEPRTPGYRAALGAAQYRTGDYGGALEMLGEYDPLRGKRQGGLQVPAALVFLAMARYQLGQKEQAQATLDQLRTLLKGLPSRNSADEALLYEAEGLLQGQAGKPAP
jgi:hypothetical protein